MTELKLPKLADRKPVRITIQVSPDLDRALRAYAQLYRETYGEAEPVPALIPAMLASFLDADKGFARRRRSHGREAC